MLHLRYLNPIRDAIGNRRRQGPKLRALDLRLRLRQGVPAGCDFPDEVAAVVAGCKIAAPAQDRFPDDGFLDAAAGLL